MATPDAPTIAALGGSRISAPFLVYLDFAGDPVRATTWPAPVAPTGTGDADLDGYTFVTLSPQFGGVDTVTRSTGGADTTKVWLSGISGPDDDLLAVLEDEASWYLRVARLWFVLRDAGGANVGAFAPYLTGRMTSWNLRAAADKQRIEISIETYLAALTGASNRNYLDQADFDPSDTSAAQSIAVANGAKKGGTAAMSVGSSGSFDDGSDYLNRFTR